MSSADAHTVDVYCRGLRLGDSLPMSDFGPTTAFIAVAQPLPVGTEVLVTADHVELRGRVARVHESVDNQTAGMRIKVEGLDQDARTWWESQVVQEDPTPLLELVVDGPSAASPAPAPKAAAEATSAAAEATSAAPEVVESAGEESGPAPAKADSKSRRRKTTAKAARTATDGGEDSPSGKQKKATKKRRRKKTSS